MTLRIYTSLSFTKKIAFRSITSSESNSNIINDNSIPGVTLNGDGGVVDYDIEKQCLAVFENVRFVLEEAGSSWEKIVDVTVFLTNIKKDFKRFNLLYKKHFESCFPCRTTVEVNCLPTPIAIELKVIATI